MSLRSAVLFGLAVVAALALLFAGVLVFFYFQMSDRTSPRNQMWMLSVAVPELAEVNTDALSLREAGLSHHVYCSALQNALHFYILPQCFEIFLSDRMQPELRGKIVAALHRPCAALQEAGQDLRARRWEYFACGKPLPIFGANRIAVISYRPPEVPPADGYISYDEMVARATSVEYVREER